MNKILLLFAGIIAPFITSAQNSDNFNYQAIVRDAQGLVKANTSVSITIEIIQGTTGGTVVFDETQAATSNAFGLVNLVIGSINPSGFDAIDWASAPYFIRVSVDGVAMGTSQLLSVPFALHAKKVESYDETDPVFLAHPANGLTSSDILNWNTAYGWGDHAGLYKSITYLPDWSELTNNPINFTSPSNNQLLKFNSVSGKWENWTPDFLIAESDPVFLAHPSYGLTSGDILNWNTAYSWGNHATAGYLTSFTETDPVFGASAAKDITGTSIANWNTSFTWGDHAGLYKPITYLPDWSELTNNPISFTSPSNNQLLRYNSVSGKWENWTANFLTTEVDGSVSNEIQTLSLNTNQLTISGTGGNSVSFTNWDTDKTDDVTLVAPTTGDMLYYNGSTWASIPKGTTGQLLSINASGVPEWRNAFAIPPATTLAATFTLPTAILNGVVNPNGLPTTVTFEYGTTISYGSTTTATQSPVNGSSSVNVSSNVSGLIAGTAYHFRVKAESALGISYGDDMSFTFLGIGISWQGGLIFYLDNTGQHGLVSASSDQGTAAWGCYQTLISGADGTAIGTGNQNTTDIVAGCITVGIAAEICSSLSLNSFTDWFLPSKDELGLMYTNLHLAGKGSFGAVNYWSSSEFSSDNAYKQNFGTGSIGTNVKNVTYSIRAVRAF